MRAAVIEEEGKDGDRLRVREVAEPPEPAPGSVLLAVRAAGVNPLDWQRARRGVRLALPSRLPRILGLDVAGEILAVGPEVTRFAPGDAVYGLCAGSFAERATARESALAKKPASLSFAEAAALPLAGLTALQGLRDRGELAAGETVLVNGAAGDVGHLAVQIAAMLQARLTAVTEQSRLDLVRGLGPARSSTPKRGTTPAATAPGTSSSKQPPTTPFSDYGASLTSDGGSVLLRRPHVDPRDAARRAPSRAWGADSTGSARRARIAARPNSNDLTLPRAPRR